MYGILKVTDRLQEKCLENRSYHLFFQFVLTTVQRQGVKKKVIRMKTRVTTVCTSVARKNRLSIAPS